MSGLASRQEPYSASVNVNSPGAQNGDLSRVQRRSGLAALARSSATGMRFSARMPFEIWSALGPRIAAHANASRWWLGDWLVFGERNYGTRYRDTIAATGLDHQTLRNYAVVARRFELSRRRDNLSFAHHAEVCALTDPQQEHWLDLATQHHWSKQELRLRIRRAKRIKENLHEPRTLRFIVDDEHEERWRQAAARCHWTFEDWVIRSLDVAASSDVPSP